MRHRVALDLTGLTAETGRTTSASWWGTLAYMLIEGTGFALMLVVYLYLWSLSAEWPPEGGGLPRLGPGSWVSAILLASIIPNVWVMRRARARDLRAVRWGLLVMSALGIASLVPRIFEFAALGARWDDNAYGSVLWILLGLHTAHVLTDLADTLVLCALMFTRHGGTARRFGDVDDNALYWMFVVAAWLPIYILIYWVPRL